MPRVSEGFYKKSIEYQNISIVYILHTRAHKISNARDVVFKVRKADLDPSRICESLRYEFETTSDPGGANFSNPRCKMFHREYLRLSRIRQSNVSTFVYCFVAFKKTYMRFTTFIIR